MSTVYTLDDAVIEAAKKLKEGEISEVISTDDNYYVVRMESLFDEEATENKKKSIVTDRKNDHYTEVLDGYKENVKYELNEDEWAKVKFDELFSIKAAQTEEDAAGADTGEAAAGADAEESSGAEDIADGADAEESSGTGEAADGADAEEAAEGEE